MSSPLRVVFDCNTFLQALASPIGPAGRCVQLALNGRVNLFISPMVLDELREVAARPKVIAKLGLVAERVDAFLEAIEIAATLLDDFPQVFSYQRDPDDAHYIDLALAADCQVIVTRDQDLLDLMDVAKPEAAEFRRRYPSFRILNPVEFLDEMAAHS